LGSYNEIVSKNSPNGKKSITPLFLGSIVGKENILLLQGFIFE